MNTQLQDIIAFLDAGGTIEDVALLDGRNASIGDAARFLEAGGTVPELLAITRVSGELWAAGRFLRLGGTGAQAVALASVGSLVECPRPRLAAAGSLLALGVPAEQVVAVHWLVNLRDVQQAMADGVPFEEAAQPSKRDVWPAYEE